MPSSYLIHCCLLLPTSIIPSTKVFSNESALCIRWPKYWSFSLNISPSNEHSGLISFRMDWLDLLAVQGTLKSLLHSSKPLIPWHSAFFKVQLSHPYMTNGKNIALTRRTFVGKVMSLLFNMLSRLVMDRRVKESWVLKNWCFGTVVLEKTLESSLDCKEIQPVYPKFRKSVLNIHWKDWHWSWNSNTLATWCEELTHLKRPWCWERLRAGGEGDDRMRWHHRLNGHKFG